MRVTFDWATLLALALAAGLGGGTCLPVAGCAPATTELERAWNDLNQQVIAPAVQKAMQETATRAATMQAGAQVIEPGYSVVVDGFFGTGVHASTTVRLVGVSGQITGHVQADAGQPASVPPPVQRETGPPTPAVITEPSVAEPG